MQAIRGPAQESALIPYPDTGRHATALRVSGIERRFLARIVSPEADGRPAIGVYLKVNL